MPGRGGATRGGSYGERLSDDVRCVHFVTGGEMYDGSAADLVHCERAGIAEEHVVCFERGFFDCFWLAVFLLLLSPQPHGTNQFSLGLFRKMLLRN